MRYRLGFIGAGNMAEAIARAAIDTGIMPSHDMIAADTAEERREVFRALGIAVAADNAQIIADADQIMLAVKPQTLSEIADHLRVLNAETKVINSIMAGVSTGKIEEAIGGRARVVRIMPNTPLMAGQGMAGIARGRNARPGDEALAMELFGAAGKAILVDESDLDAVTAVSGSGPAYVFYLSEAMEQAAQELGLGQHASVLVTQTILGAATLMCRSGDSPEELRRKVTSPGGTTEAAVHHLDGNSTREVFINAIKAARNRSCELGA